MRDLLLFLDARLGEPSTYSGLAALFLATHVNVDPGVMHAITLWGTGIAAGMAALLSEVGQKPPSQIASDAVEALAAALKKSS